MERLKSSVGNNRKSNNGKSASPSPIKNPKIKFFEPDLDEEYEDIEQIPLNRDQIARRAYEIWKWQGQPMGRDLDHWLQAERELGRSLKGQRKGWLP